MSADAFDDQNLFTHPDLMTGEHSNAQVQAMLRAEIVDLREQIKILQQVDHSVLQIEIDTLKRTHAVEITLINIRQKIWGSRAAKGLPSMAEMVEMLNASDLFDAQWYTEKNPDLVGTGISVAEHYIRAGTYEGRNPGPDFQSMAYYVANPDVAQSGWPALLHYIAAGQKEGRTLGI